MRTCLGLSPSTLGSWLGVLTLVVWQLRPSGLVASPYTDDSNVANLAVSAVNTNHRRELEEQPSANDWFDKEKWTSNPITNACFVVEDVCHSAGSWFYNSQSNNTAQQPNLALDLKYVENGRKANKFVTVPASYPAQIRVDHTSHDQALSGQCPYSPIPNHVVVHGYYNHMLGEFYERCLMGLVEIFSATIDDTDVNWSDIATQTQLYLHLNSGDTAPLLTSHRLLLGALSTNPVHRLEALLDGTQCQCMKRVVFCGYKEVATEGQGQNVTLIRPKGNVGLDMYYFNGKTKEASPLYDSVRTLLRQRLVQGHPSMKAMVQTQRMNIIHTALNRSDHTELGPIDESEWKIIGFSQRNERRRWKNLDAVLDYCLKHYTQYKVACCEVNLEDPSFDSPLRHVQAHASLDAFIGIHGASLTEAVLMPPNSVVIELLPWLYKETTVGRWTTWASRPTPLGVLFSETDLVHVGVPLRRESSIDSCDNEDDLRGCFRRTQNQWSNRQFEVDPHFVMEELVHPLIIKKKEFCDEWLAAGGENVVFYNVPCNDNQTSQASIQHYYRNEEWVENIQNSWETDGIQTK